MEEVRELVLSQRAPLEHQLLTTIMPPDVYRDTIVRKTTLDEVVKALDGLRRQYGLTCLVSSFLATSLLSSTGLQLLA